MATKTINTRIKNKVAELSSWNNATGTLLDGEIAIVRVPTGATYTNPVTGVDEPVVELLMKVGDGVHKFNEVDADGNPYLPWLSAKASDVYNWAKEQDPSVITVKYNKGTSSNPSWQSSTLADILKDLETVESAVEGLKSDVSGVRGLLSVESDPASKTGVVQGITYNASTGKFTVSYGLVAETDIDTGAVTETKIATDAVTTAKIKNGNVTDDKIETVSASKVIYTPGADPVTLPEKIEEVESRIADINTAIGGGVHFRGEVTAPAKLDENLTTRSVTINGKSYAANNGDVVIQGSKEYIWVAATETTGTWKELGDLSRVGTVEELLSGLPESARTVNQYVTHIVKENGKLVAKKARPLAAEIQYASGNTTDTVYSKIEANAAAIAERAATDHVHGNITKDGTITATAVTTATGVLVYDSSNKIQRTTAANARTIIGAAESDHNHDTRYVRFDTNTQGLTVTQKTNARTNIGAADAGHTHSGYEGQLTNIESNYIQAKKDTATNTYTAMVGEDTIIFDCGGAPIA